MKEIQKKVSDIRAVVQEANVEFFKLTDDKTGMYKDCFEKVREVLGEQYKNLNIFNEISQESSSKLGVYSELRLIRCALALNKYDAMPEGFNEDAYRHLSSAVGWDLPRFNATSITSTLASAASIDLGAGKGNG